MTHRQPAAFGSPVFSHPCPRLFSSIGRNPPDLRPPRGLPARSPSTPRQISGLCRAPPDLRPPRGLPARSPSAPRASLGASARSPARPTRPRGGLQSGGACAITSPPTHRPRGGLQSGGSWRTFPMPSQALAPHMTQNSPSTSTSPISQPYFRAVAARVLSALRSSWESPACDVTTPDRAVKPKLSSQEAIYCRLQCVYSKIMNHSV